MSDLAGDSLNFAGSGTPGTILYDLEHHGTSPVQASVYPELNRARLLDFAGISERRPEFELQLVK